jgi:sensor histidine kinase YesM/CHASE3 domain sensor protein
VKPVGRMPSWRGLRSMRGKMFAISVFPIFLMGLTGIFTTFTSIAAISSVNTLFSRNIYLRGLRDDLEAAKNNLSAYLSTKNSDSLRLYTHYSRKLSERAAHLDSPIRDSPDALTERNISTLLSRYVSEADKAVEAKRGRNIGEYTSRFRDAETLAVFLSERIDSLSQIELNGSLDLFFLFSKNLERIQALNAFMILAALLLDAFLIGYLSLRLTDPIVHLSAEAKRIASGIFDARQIPEESNDEIGTMTKAFNVMKLSIKDYIEEMRSKAEIENRLMDEKLKNLEMAGIIKNSELRNLQARINPHFLFNTLNAGIQLAVVEDADRTRVFLENLSSLMRYSFRGLNSPVTLNEEMQCLQSFMHIMAIRFPSLFSMEFGVDEGMGHAVMPKMVIQPLVENSFRHGFQDMESGARLRVRAFPRGSDVVIEVEDNGKGIAPDRVSAIMSAAERGEDYSADEEKDSSLGIANVLRRLRIFYGRDDVLEIGSGPLGGTLVALTLPFRVEY